MDRKRRLDPTAPTRPLPALLLLGLVIVALPGNPALADKSHDARGLASVLERVVQEGLVSWYGNAFHDRRTASGERFDKDEYTMAHPTLPFGTQVRVTNLRNGRSVVVRVNDRGPFVGKRIADLSAAAAAQLGFLKRGIARARIEVLGGEAPDLDDAP